jgi:2-(1,2-epoxy-1,2-dihydrophenyl)acetyl-CoA isomerase
MKEPAANGPTPNGLAAETPDAVVSYVQQDAVVQITLERPDALNAFNRALRVQLAAALQRASADPTVRAVALTAAGRAFSAGADLKAVQAEAATGSSPGAVVRRQLEQEYFPGIQAIIDSPKPVIAAVEGLVAGIGGAYVLACDLVVMAEDADFVLPFHNIGLVPDGGLTWLLERQVGARRAFELAVECSRVSAARCRELGLANRVVAKGTAVQAALAWARALAQRPTVAIAQTKRLLRGAPALGFAQALRAEIDAQTACIDSQDFREGVSAFLEKRAARFSGR